MNFKELYSVDCSNNIEKKSNGKANLSYLSWTWAFKEILTRCPDMTYEIEMFEDKTTGAMVPYTFDPKTGYMVFTKVTIDGVTRRMWLPVMDSANAAMKDKPYEYETGFGQNKKVKTCAAADMFDINKTIMRCLTKNFAMFGLGLYIYAGEDIPKDLTSDEKIDAKSAKVLETMMKPNQIEYIKQNLGVQSIADLTKAQYTQVMQSLHSKEQNNASNQ